MSERTNPRRAAMIAAQRLLRSLLTCRCGRPLVTATEIRLCRCSRCANRPAQAAAYASN